VFAIGLVVAGASAYAATPTPSPPAKGKLERLRIAVAPLGWDTNFTWLQSRSGQLDKRPALEYLIGIDRHTGAYIPELAEKWEMAPDGRSWTITLRKGVPFHDNWGSSPPETFATRSSSSPSLSPFRPMPPFSVR
jgi:ABC-type transport system substrate-binding protein